MAVLVDGNPKVMIKKLDASASSVIINFCGLSVATCVLILLKKYFNDISIIHKSLYCLLALVSPIIILELIFLKPQLRSSSGLNFSSNAKIDFKRVLIKLLGFYSTIIFVASVYWAFPEYQANFYDNYWQLLKIIIPIILVCAIPYFFLIDKIMVNPHDGYWHFGQLILGNYSKINYQEISQHARGWIVKLFFLPLMYIYLVSDLKYLFNLNFLAAFDSNFKQFCDIMCTILYSVDVIVACAGYIFTFRILDSHIKSSEPTMLGWLVALECYQPFFGMFYSSYLKYNDNYTWTSLFPQDGTELNLFWGSLILLLISIYAYATVAFGIRFSNFTNRGIITNGPYKYCKHPAYVTKCTSWWLISVPFIPRTSISDSIRTCLLLLFLNIIYYLRARTEEKHLSSDPVYVKYALEMNKKSIFAPLGRLFPFLQYKSSSAC